MLPRRGSSASTSSNLPSCSLSERISLLRAFSSRGSPPSSASPLLCRTAVARQGPCADDDGTWTGKGSSSGAVFLKKRSSSPASSGDSWALSSPRNVDSSVRRDSAKCRKSRTDCEHRQTLRQRSGTERGGRTIMPISLPRSGILLLVMLNPLSLSSSDRNPMVWAKHSRNGLQEQSVRRR